MGGTKERLLSKQHCDQLVQYITEMKFIPGGRYLYYAGRPLHSWNNCYLLRGEEDTREEWGALLHRASDCLMSGGGIGIDYSVFRPENAPLKRTGGKSTGPIPLMKSVNEMGRNVMQGGSRRSAIYASLNWQHEDNIKFLRAKNWHDMRIPGTDKTVWDAKVSDPNYHAPLDMTNISLNYDDEWLKFPHNGIFWENCKQALMTGEPGFSFNFGPKQKETLRNACTEVTSEDDSDVCNLGSVNLAEIRDIGELRDVTYFASMFLACGSVRSDLPYAKVRQVREKNRRQGLGLMGIHEWLLRKNFKYEVNAELHLWLANWKQCSEHGANDVFDDLGLSRPIAYRAIAPTGTIGLIASTTTGIEPLYAVAYKRTYLVDGKYWKYQYVIDHTAEYMIRELGLDPTSIDSAYGMASDVERRIAFQADVQDYVDMAISSTINLPAWGSKFNNEDTVASFATILASYAPRLRGFTCYPDGARGGQPLVEVDYATARKNIGVIFEDNDSCKGGVCGI